MYPEVTSHLRKIEDVLNSRNFLFLDARVEEMFRSLSCATQFLAERLWKLEHPETADPRGFLPGSDD